MKRSTVTEHDKRADSNFDGNSDIRTQRNHIATRVSGNSSIAFRPPSDTSEQILSIALEVATELKINFRRNAPSIRYRFLEATFPLMLPLCRIARFEWRDLRLQSKSIPMIAMSAFSQERNVPPKNSSPQCGHPAPDFIHSAQSGALTDFCRQPKNRGVCIFAVRGPLCVCSVR